MIISKYLPAVFPTVTVQLQSKRMCGVGLPMLTSQSRRSNGPCDREVSYPIFGHFGWMHSAPVLPIEHRSGSFSIVSYKVQFAQRNSAIPLFRPRVPVVQT
ncbi:hypothetical protein PM082_003554 [Marasmius tenuissimus]|nr:hypothetical protein PM082_003554 [Marasmius tenuissimus]